MVKCEGMLTQKALATAIKRGEIETVILAFPDHYGRLMGKRYDAEFFLENPLHSGMESCNYLLTVDMDMNPMSGYQFTNWQQGYGDMHCQPDWSSIRILSWLEKTALIFGDLFDSEAHNPIEISPRTLLKTQLKRIQAAGYSPMMASELEYYLFKDSYQHAHNKDYYHLKPMSWYREDYHILQGTREEIFNAQARRHLKNSGIPVENSKGEWGIGQNELNICYSDPLTMADRHIVYKQCLKELAQQLEMSVTFMAKYDSEQAGSSCHLHISLYQGNKNCFTGNHKISHLQCSDTFRWFLGGWMYYMPELMVFYAPTINAYKRYQEASWAPTKLAWSIDNRTAGFRIIGDKDNLRIECRIPGADINPYLAFAAALASGLAGIEEKINPPDIFQGDVYTAQSLPTLPTSLDEAVRRFKQSSFAKKTFGEMIVDHYAHFYDSECQAYAKAVTDWERRRYFEQI